MNRTTLLALVGAVVLASGAYALGSQAGGGDAAAARTQAPAAPPYGPGGPGHGPGGPGHHADLSALATRLGVSESALRSALADIRPNADRRDRHQEMAQALADALGIDVAKVTAALDRLHGTREGDFAAALAQKLGLTAAKVRQALDSQRGRHGDPAALAAALGVTQAKLRAAFAQLRPDRHGGPDGAALAQALGVTEARLQAAFDKLRAAHEANETKLRDQFAQQLADRLHIDVAKVKAALSELRPAGRHHP